MNCLVYYILVGEWLKDSFQSSRVYHIDVATGETTMLLDNKQGNVRLTPDGKTVLLTLHRELVEGKDEKLINEFWQVAIDGGQPHKIMETDISVSIPQGIRINPDGQYIVFSASIAYSELLFIENFLPSNNF